MAAGHRAPSERSGDLFDGLAAALLAEHAVPELASGETTAEKLAELLRASPAAAHLLLRGYLSKAAGSLPKAKDSPVEPEARWRWSSTSSKSCSPPAMFRRKTVRPSSPPSALAESGQTWVIATLRNDFYHRCAANPAIAELKSGSGQYDLSPPDVSEIAQLVRRPAFAAGLRFEEDFETGERLDDLLRDATAANRESLPLLEFTLDELYRRRSGSVLTLQAYRELGGIEGALAKRADDVLGELSEAARNSLTRVFWELVAVGEAEGDRPTRKQAPLDVFGKVEETSPSRQLVDKFIKERLLTAKKGKGVPVVEVAHEARLSHWQPLVDWLARDRELLRVRWRISAAAVRWDEEGRPADRLLPTGKPLDEANQLLAASFDLNAREGAFIAASRAQARGRKNAKRLAIAVLVVLAITALVAAIVANRMRRDAQWQLAMSYIYRGVNELEHGDRAQGFAILGQAYRTAVEAKDDGLRRSTCTLLGARDSTIEPGLTDGSLVVPPLAFSADGTQLMTAHVNYVKLWNVATGKQTGGTIEHDNRWLLYAVALSPDGTKIATARSVDKTARLRDAATGQPWARP